MKKLFFLMLLLILNMNAYSLNHLSYDTNTCFQNNENEFPLHEAVKKGDKVAVIDLLKSGYDVNEKNLNGDTVLHLAIKKSKDDLISLLVEYGADSKLQNDIYVSSILLAAAYRKKDILKKILQNNDPSNYDLKEALYCNDINAFEILLDCCKKDPFLDRAATRGILYAALKMENKKIIDLCIKKNPDCINWYINGHLPLHYAAIYSHNELFRYFVENCKFDINANDCFDLTPLHYAVLYGNYDLVNYLIQKKCLINPESSKKLDFCKSCSTPLDLAIQFGHKNIMNLLLKNAGKNNVNFVKNIKTNSLNNIVLFVDWSVEKIKNDKHPLESVNTVFSSDLYNLIKQKTCPIIIFGKHLLKNALRLSCSLNDWHIIEFSRDGVDGYIIVPKHIVAENFNSNDSIETIFTALNFSVSKIMCNYVDETYVLNKKDKDKELRREDFSFFIPGIIESLFLPAKRFVYWGGHGWVKNNPSVGDLFNQDANNLLTIFENKDTRLVYISSCYFGGRNFEITEDISDMIIVSSATTEISTSSRSGVRINNWNAFFNMLSEADSRFSQNSDYYKYLANKVYPFIVTFNPNISNFPHIKLPGYSSFKLLPINNEAMLIDDDMILRSPNNKEFIDVRDKRLLEVDSSSIDKAIRIRNKIPLIISNKLENIFEQIYVESFKKNKENDFTLIIKKLTRSDLFCDSTLENTFLIKEFKTKGNFFIQVKENDTDKKIELPTVLYNVVINRGPDNKCEGFFSTDKDVDYKNSFYISYEKKSDKWIAYNELNDDELMLYKCFINK
ncbi:MAG: ankyrin repeat domain-containing protein [bacterium]